ncbi:Nramp family divalent metal transporter [Rothia koreensis]|jgi:Mn2+/Fe2+ NRAMP family transporter|uniref:Nramp family divalent metal transporter n=1 Tax=Rothia koreensis TaxID=592378 RepID=UPI0037C9A551
MSTKTYTQASPAQQYPEQHAIPRGLGLVTSLGPGLVLAMTFLGTGDLVSSSVSGANYGYALLWTLVLSLIARTFIISAIAKYTLMNRFGDTQILEGFKRIFPWLPGLMAAVVLIAGFVTQAAFLKASAIGLYQLTGGSWGGSWGNFACALIVMALTLFMVTRKKSFAILEYFARFASVAMILAFLYALVRIGHFDLPGFVRGMAFEVPPESMDSAFAPIVIASATIGTIAGNMPNMLYSGFMKDKGWVGPRYRRIQQLDLMAGMAPLLAINLLFWIVASEFSRDNPGFVINTEHDLSQMMSLVVGPAGPILLWLCIFLAAMTSFPPQSRGFAQLAVNGIHLSTRKGKRYLGGKDEHDPLFKKIQIIGFIALPLLASLPAAPNLVALNIVGTSVSTVLSLPFIVIGILVLTGSKKFMADYAVNKWWQSVLLAVLGVIAIVVGFQIAMNIPDMLATAFSGK